MHALKHSGRGLRSTNYNRHHVGHMDSLDKTGPGPAVVIPCKCKGSLLVAGGAGAAPPFRYTPLVDSPDITNRRKNCSDLEEAQPTVVSAGRHWPPQDTTWTPHTSHADWSLITTACQDRDASENQGMSHWEAQAKVKRMRFCFLHSSQSRRKSVQQRGKGSSLSVASSEPRTSK
ncbi:hypothetical protein QR685DRAFT_568792 [Neurospora intermedia]|uniref:Uncharacterized protein n=1 Tax=Neurospora intermedia TaxID=5142 RepID=A0ABR3DTZ0_NEUIN